MSQSQAIVDYYDSAYGPTIRISTDSMDELKNIRHLFKVLASEQLKEATFESKINVKMIGINSLQLRSVPNEKMLAPNLTMRNTQTKLREIIWTYSTFGWLECMELVDGIIESGNPGHTYLTLSDNNITIELSYRE